MIADALPQMLYFVEMGLAFGAAGLGAFICIEQGFGHDAQARIENFPPIIELLRARTPPRFAIGDAHGSFNGFNHRIAMHELVGYALARQCGANSGQRC
jgi:hypothetical protein